MNKLINLFLALLFIIPVVGQAQITTDRQDGRFQSTRGTVQYMLKQMKPAYAFDPSFTPAEFKEWHVKPLLPSLLVRQEMRSIHNPLRFHQPALLCYRQILECKARQELYGRDRRHPELTPNKEQHCPATDKIPISQPGNHPAEPF